MNIKYKSILLFLVFFSFGLMTKAQKGNFSLSPTIGLNFPILDNGLGFYLGLNPAYSVSNYFAFEGQLSYAYTDVEDSFLAGEEESQSNFNALAGGRLYILSAEKKARPYLNLLMGGMYNWERDFIEITFGLSTGVFVDINRFLVGFSFETPGNIIVKAGYVF